MTYATISDTKICNKIPNFVQSIYANIKGNQKEDYSCISWVWLTVTPHSL